ncbi:O-antigen ligase family protein [Providencia stuartii]|uniref:O-antigen ligase family protein n=1 Tax=Providencia TaxID=586 RepID=UPI00234A7C19|nr:MULTISPECIES: O-antigen ligase family protein [Providencia]MDE8748069.1 O-antigen ligase family protein [Providencia thailandensis]MDE8767366.1 O-antigen ligase family protein [Providencia thailandensis]MDE8779710.1 O-antigen ligase family protein [Providencia thailandensis]MDE8784111.1 O-antigen ligase family protein [Providencia thailandensis]MDE8787796.1 O-antigen ligase family protein [Providencia thailandensis]
MKISTSSINNILIPLLYINFYLILTFDKLKNYNFANILFLVSCLLIIFIYFIKKNKKIKIDTLLYSFNILLGLLFAYFSIFFEPNLDSLFSLAKLTLIMMMSVITAQWLLNNLSKTIIYSSTFSILICIYIYMEFSSSLYVGFSAMFDNPNSLGLVLSLPLFLNLYSFLFYENKKELLLSLISFILIIPLCLYSNSRTSILSPLISILFILPFYLKNRVSIKYTLIITLITCIIFSLFMLLPIIGEIINSTIIDKFSRKGSDNITNGRAEYILEALNYLKYLSPSLLPSFIIVDNTYIAYAVNFGIISAFLFFSTLIIYPIMLFISRRNYNEKQYYFLFGIYIYYFFYSILESIRITPLTLFFLCGFFIIIRNFSNKKIKSVNYANIVQTSK